MGDKGDYFVDEVYDRPDKVVIGTSGREVVKQDPTKRVVVGQECPPVDPLTFENIMGQEDFFRQESGARVDNRGTARIVITTPGNAEVKRIEYDVNPVDEDNPVFNETWTIDSSGGTHEVFRAVVPDALYAFQVIITQPGEGEKTSGIYYFQTGEKVTVKSVWDNTINTTLEIFVPAETILAEVGSPDVSGEWSFTARKGIRTARFRGFEALVEDTSIDSVGEEITPDETDAFGNDIVTIVEKV